MSRYGLNLVEYILTYYSLPLRSSLFYAIHVVFVRANCLMFLPAKRRGFSREVVLVLQSISWRFVDA